MHSYRLWRVLVIAIESLVLGIASAAVLHAAGLGTRSGLAASSGPFPAAPGRVGPGMMGRYPAPHHPVRHRRCPARSLTSPSPIWAA